MMIAKEDLRASRALRGSTPVSADSFDPVGPEARVRLLLTHRAMILGYLGSILHDPHLVEDVFQEVALVVLRKGAALRNAGDFPVWLRRIARLEALSALRRLQRRPRPFDQSVLDLLDSGWASGDGEEESPRIEALRSCLERLTPQARKLVDLRYGQNLSGQSLAERRSQALNTVYVALARIHRVLSGCIRSKLLARGPSHA